MAIKYNEEYDNENGKMVSGLMWCNVDEMKNERIWNE